MLQLIKTHDARDHYMQFASMVSQVILHNHQLSPFRQVQSNQQVPLHYVSICEQLLKLAQSVAQFAQQLTTPLEDQTLQMSLNQVAGDCVSSCRNLLMRCQQRSTGVSSSLGEGGDERAELMEACEDAQHSCLKLILTIERTEEHKIVRSAEWCMDKIVLLEGVNDPQQFNTHIKNFEEAHFIFVKLISHRLDSLVDSNMREKLSTAVEAVKQSLPMLKSAVQGCLRLTPEVDSRKAEEGRLFAVDRSLKALGSCLELVESSPDVDQILQKESHFHTVAHNMLDVLQPDKRFDYLRNLPVDTEAVLRHVMLVSHSVKDARTNSALLGTSQKLLERVKSMDELHYTATNAPFEAQSENEEFNLACEEVIHLLGELIQLVRGVTVENVFDSFLNTPSPSPALQLEQLANELSGDARLSEDQVLEQMSEKVNEFKLMNRKMLHVVSQSLAVFPYSTDSKKVNEGVFGVEQCALQLECESLGVALATNVSSSAATLSLCRRNWELHFSKLRLSLYDLISREILLKQAVASCERDLDQLKNANNKRHITAFTDQLASALSSRLKGLCLVANEIVSQSSDVIFRNGVLALANQVAKACKSLEMSYDSCVRVREERSLNASASMKQACEQLAEKISLTHQCIDRLLKGLNRCAQPGILNPIRKHLRSNTCSQGETQQTSSPSVFEELFTPQNHFMQSYKPLVLSSAVPSFKTTQRPGDLMPEQLLAKEALHSLKMKDEVKVKEDIKALLEKVTQRSKLLAEYCSLSPEDEKKKKVESEIALIESLTSNLTGALSGFNVKDKISCDKIEHLLNSIEREEESQLGDMYSEAVGGVGGVWLGPPLRVKRACDERDRAQIQMEIGVVDRVAKEISALARDLIQMSFEGGERLGLMPLGSNGGGANEEKEGELKDRLEKSCQHLDMSTRNINRLCEDPRRMNLRQEDCEAWSMRVGCCLQNIDKLLASHPGKDQWLEQMLSSLSTSVAQLNSLPSSPDLPSFKSASQSTLKLTSLAALGVEDLDDQMRMSQEADQFHKLFSQLISQIHQLQTESETNSHVTRGVNSSGTGRLQENTLLQLRQWALKMRTLEKLTGKRVNELCTPVDDLFKAAINQQTSNSLGLGSKASANDDVRTMADKLHSQVGNTRRVIQDALSTCRDAAVTQKASQALSNLSDICGNITKHSKQLSAGNTCSPGVSKQLRREWALTNLYLAHLVQSAPGVSKPDIARVLKQLRCNSSKDSSFLDPNSRSFTTAERPIEAEDSVDAPEKTTELQSQLDELRFQLNQQNQEGDNEGNEPQYKRREPKRPVMLSHKNTLTLLKAAENLRQQVNYFEDSADNQNYMISATKRIAQQMHDLAEFTQGQPPLKTKEDFVNTAKAISSNGHVILKWAKLIADRCIDQKGLGKVLRDSCEPIAMLGTQLSVVASVKAVCPDKHETDDALVTNARNLLSAVSNTITQAEACCIKGVNLKRPDDDLETSEGFEAVKMATRWKRHVNQQLKESTAPTVPVDNFGLRKTSGLGRIP